MKKQRSGLHWLWLSLVVFLLDWATKHYFVNTMLLGQSKPVLPFVNFTLAFNQGAAFSFLTNQGGWQQWLFGAIAVVICIFIFIWLARLRNKPVTGVALALIFAGAIGNLYDRIAYGFVIDFIDFHVGNWHWPVFNIADSAIVIGVILLLVITFFADRNKERGI